LAGSEMVNTMHRSHLSQRQIGTESLQTPPSPQVRAARLLVNVIVASSGRDELSTLSCFPHHLTVPKENDRDRVLIGRR